MNAEDNETSEIFDNDFLTRMRNDLFKFAALQLRDDAVAEDVVQETLMAALADVKKFSGRAALKTWVFSILRNKIVDHFRRQRRTINVSSLSPEEDSMDQAFESLFKANAHWTPQARPTDWGDPEE